MPNEIRIRYRESGTDAPLPNALSRGELGYFEQNGKLYIGTTDGSVVHINPVAAGSAVWGAITGTITDQTDLVSYVAGQAAGGLYAQATPPVGANEGNLWYETDTENLYVYREVSPSVFSWEPLVVGTTDSDTIDGGNY